MLQFLGTLVGSTLGLLAILAGALFNAHLNRKRDDHLRSEEARAVRAALIGELTGYRDAFNVMSTKTAANDLAPTDGAGGFFVPDLLAGERVLPALLPKLGLFSSALIQQVIDTYMTLDQFYDKARLIALGEVLPPSRRGGFVKVPAALAPTVSALASGTAKKIDATIASLKAAG
jgi:hypothetical protein